MKGVLIELERRFWDAAGDPDFYQTHLADDAVMAFHIGVMDKPAVVAAMEGAAEWGTHTMDEMRYVELGLDAAALVYTTEATPAAGGDAYRAAVTSVYRRDVGSWRLVLHQQSPLAE